MSLARSVAANCYDRSTAYETITARALAQIYPTPSGTKLRHTDEQSSHPGLPLQLVERDGFLQKAIQPFQELKLLSGGGVGNLSYLPVREVL